MIVSKEIRLKMSKAHLGHPHKKHKKICVKGHLISKVGRFKDYSYRACKKLATERLRRNGYMRVYGKKWRKENPEKNLAYQRKYTYGVTVEEIDLLVKKQKGLCALCRNQKKLGVDHNHKTGKIRGLLCNSCNLLLGLMHEDLKLVKRIDGYLK